MRNLPPLKTLPVFEAVAKHLSISKAAAELCVTHSAVSQAIKHLEDSLNVLLLKRDKRNMKLTPIGKEFLLAVKNGFDNIESGMVRLQKRHDPHAIAINMPTSFATTWFVLQLNDFEIQYPDYHLTINTPAKVVDFSTEPLDGAIYFGTGNWPSLIAETLFPEIIFPICKPGLIDGQLSWQAALRKYPLIMINSLHFKNMWTEWFNEKNFTLPKRKKTLTFDHPLIALQAVKKGMGITLSNQLLAKSGLENKMLERPFKEQLLGKNHYYFVYPKEYKDEQKIKIFLQWIKTRLSKKNDE